VVAVESLEAEFRKKVRAFATDFYPELDEKVRAAAKEGKPAVCLDFSPKSMSSDVIRSLIALRYPTMHKTHTFYPYGRIVFTSCLDNANLTQPEAEAWTLYEAGLPTRTTRHVEILTQYVRKCVCKGQFSAEFNIWTSLLPKFDATYFLEHQEQIMGDWRTQFPGGTFEVSSDPETGCNIKWSIPPFEIGGWLYH